MSYIGKPLSTNGISAESMNFTGAGPYTMARSPGKADAMQVFLGGVIQRPYTDYDISGNQLTLVGTAGVPTDTTVKLVLVYSGFAALVGVVSDNSISTIKLVDGAVTETKLGFNSFSEGYGSVRSTLAFNAGSPTPNFLTSQFFDLTVTSSFTLNMPQVSGTNVPAGATAGMWCIDCTNTGAGGYTLTLDSNMTLVPGYSFDGTTGVKNRIWIYLKTGSPTFTADVYIEQV